MKAMDQQNMDRILFGALRAIYRFERTKVARFGLTYEEIYLLQFLRRRSPVRMGDIAREMARPVSTATRVIDRLQKRRLVTREKDPGDKRNILVSLTEAGDAMVTDVEAHTFETVSRNLKRFTAGDIDAFVKTAVLLDQLLAVQEEE